MRIAVVGAGAVGGTIAALLAGRGHDVVVTARGEERRTLNRDGLRLTGAWGDHQADVAAVAELTESVDVAFVCVKAHDAPAALGANRAGLEHAVVVLVQNGLGGVDQARTFLPEASCLGALALFAASFVEPGRRTVTAAGPLYVGGDANAREAADEVVALLNPVMPARASANFVGAQWSKLIVNQVNALPAITGLSVQQTIADRRLRRIVSASMREAVRMGLGAGIRYGTLSGLSHGLLRTFAAMPPAIGQLLPRLMARRMGAVPNPGSTLQSVRRGRATEIDHLNGAVVDAAEQHRGHAPVNRVLVELVHEVERTGRFIPPDEVVARMAAALG